MLKVGLVYHTDYLLHDTGGMHPEKGERLESIVRHLRSTGLMNELFHIELQSSTIEMISAVHNVDYIYSVKDCIEKGETVLDLGDTHVGKDSWRIALLAAGGACSAVDAVMKGEADRVFCAIRLPVHHACRSDAMGFCVFNNVAVATRHLQKKYGIERIAIVDWDVHHGNGTQEMFYDDSSVFYLSIHQFPHWPGTGASSEVGEGKGRGFNCNVPVPPGTGDEEYLLLFREAVEGKMERFKPEFVFISAGFDAHINDPLSDLMFGEDVYAEMTDIVCRCSDNYASGRIVSLLEGGYELKALANSVGVHIRHLMA